MYLVVFSMCVSILSLFVISFQLKVSHEKLLLLNEIHIPKRNFELPYDPPHSAWQNLTDKEKIYIAIIDSVYEPNDLMCALKNSWVAEVENMSFVDGVEMYSASSYEDTNCSMKTITFDDPPERFPINGNPSCYIMYTVLQMFMKRSDANWLLVLSDGAYVNPKTLPAFVEELSKVKYYKLAFAKGQCVELRDYFQIFAPSSGVLFSRSAVKKIIDNPRKLEISCEIEIPAFEAVAHQLDDLNIFAIHNHEPRFLGQPFTQHNDYLALETGVYTGLKECQQFYESPRVCFTRSNKFNDIVVWAGTGGKIDKIQFLEKAKMWMNNAPQNLGFMYNSYQADLCLFKK